MAIRLSLGQLTFVSALVLAIGTGCGSTSPTGVGGTAGTGGSTGGTGGGGTGGGTGGLPGEVPPIGDLEKLGPYPSQTYTSGLVQSGTNYNGVAVYYPGGDAPTPFPGVVAVPGWAEGIDIFPPWGQFLSSHGFAVLAIGVKDANNFDVGTRKTALEVGIGLLRAENTRAGSPLQGKLDVNRLVVMGHSMGGGGTIAAAATNACGCLKAAIALTPYTGGFTGANDRVPTLIFAGSGDSLAPPASNAVTFYNTIPAGTPKAYQEFSGAAGLTQHFVASNPLSRDAWNPNGAPVAHMGLAWLRVFVNNDARYKQFITASPTNNARFMTASF